MLPITQDDDSTSFKFSSEPEEVTPSHF